MSQEQILNTVSRLVVMQIGIQLAFFFFLKCFCCYRESCPVAEVEGLLVRIWRFFLQ